MVEEKVKAGFISFYCEILYIGNISPHSTFVQALVIYRLH